MDKNKNIDQSTSPDHNIPLQGEIDDVNEMSMSMNPEKNAIQLERDVEKMMIRERIIAYEMRRSREIEDEVRRDLMMQKQIMGMRNLYGLSNIGDSSSMLMNYGFLGSRYTPNPNYDEYLMNLGTSDDNIDGRMKLISGACDGIDEYMQINPNPLENYVIGSEEEKRKMEEIALGKWPFDRDPSCVAPPVVTEKHNAEDVTTEVVMAEAMPTAGMKRKAETPARACDEETTPMSTTVSKDSQKWFCSVCQVSTTSEGTLNVHFQGRKHRAKEARFNANGSTGIISMGSNTADNSAPPLKPVSIPSSTQENRSAAKTWECSMCQLSLTSEIHLISHRQGKKHKAMEAKLQAGEIISNIEGVRPLKSQEMFMPSSNATAADTDKQWYCSLCGVSASSESNLNDHFKGKKHQAKAGLPQQRIVKVNHQSTEKGSGIEVTKEKSLDGDDSRKREEKADGVVSMNQESLKKTEVELMDDSSNPKMLAISDGNKQDKSLGEECSDQSMEFVKYWHCKMCNKGTHDEATMAAHRKSNEHQTLLKKHGGGLISVVNVPKVAVETEGTSKEESSA